MTVFLELCLISYIEIQTVMFTYECLVLKYMKDNPERFIESNTENCWIEYLSNMAKQGTWADGLIIQAVADKFHLKIHIVETNPGFAEFNVIQAVNPSCELRLIYLGHVGEYHYFSSVTLDQCPDSLNKKNHPH